jgi:hypothetical protein
LPVELGVEDLLSRPEVELPRRGRQEHPIVHDGSLQVRVGVVLAGLVVPVVAVSARRSVMFTARGGRAC